MSSLSDRSNSPRRRIGRRSPVFMLLCAGIGGYWLGSFVLEGRAGALVVALLAFHEWQYQLTRRALP